MRTKTNARTLSTALLRKLDDYWRAANYLSVVRLCHCDKSLLKKPLTLAHNKPCLLGHWGTSPELNFVYGFSRIAGRLFGQTASGRTPTL